MIPSRSVTEGGRVEECVGVLRTRQDREGENLRDEGGRQRQRGIFFCTKEEPPPFSGSAEQARTLDFRPRTLQILNPGLFKFSEDGGPALDGLARVISERVIAPLFESTLAKCARRYRSVSGLDFDALSLGERSQELVCFVSGLHEHSTAQPKPPISSQDCFLSVASWKLLLH